MDIITAFKRRVEAAIEAHGLAPSTFGQAAIGDPNFVADLERGREPKMSTIAKVDAHIAALEADAAAKSKTRKRA